MSKIRKSARGQQCQVRIPHICNGNPETVVLAHLNGGGGGMKNPDYQGAYACSDCHTWLDGGYANDSHLHPSRDYRDLLHLQGVIRTQELLREQGLIIVK